MTFEEIQKRIDKEFLKYQRVLQYLYTKGIFRHPINKYLTVNYPPKSIAENINQKDEKRIFDIIDEHIKNTGHLGIYIHTPFCSRFCTFCSYPISTASFCDFKIKRNVDFIIKEIKVFSEKIRNKPHHIPALFFGGGSPSLMKVVDMKRIIEAVRRELKVQTFGEVTLEVHPEIVKNYRNLRSYFKQLYKIGVNRINVGLQSSDNHILQITNRGHTLKDVEKILNVLKSFNFHLSIDSLVELPKQNYSSIYETMRFIKRWNADSVSFYSLHLKYGTVDYFRIKKCPELYPGPIEIFKFLLMGNLLLNNMGYELLASNYYRKKEKTGRYETEVVKRWHAYKDIMIGFGPGAYSRSVGSKKDFLYWNEESPELYNQLISRDQLGIEKFAILDFSESRRLEMMLLLETEDNKRFFNLLAKLPTKEQRMIKGELNTLQKLNLIKVIKNKVGFTPIGQYLREEVIAALLISRKVLKALSKIKDERIHRVERFPSVEIIEKIRKVILNS